jgi:hypothetical protein
MLQKIVALYLKGAIVPEQLVVESLQMIDPRNPTLVLSELPKEILERMLRFTNDYQPNGMVTNYGPLPTEVQVRAAKKWIKSHLRQEKSPLN